MDMTLVLEPGTATSPLNGYMDKTLGYILEPGYSYLYSEVQVLVHYITHV